MSTKCEINVFTDSDRFTDIIWELMGRKQEFSISYKGKTNIIVITTTNPTLLLSYKDRDKHENEDFKVYNDE